MKLYPNPASESATVYLQGVSESGAVVSVFDRLGREVMRQKVEEGTQQLVLRFSAQQFISGKYLVRVTTSEAVLTERLLLLR